MRRLKKDQCFDDGTSVRSDFRESGRRIRPSKNEQLCAQVRRALEFALLGELHDERLLDVMVDDVRPGSEPGRMVATFAVADGATVEHIDEVRRVLESARGLLVAEVARAINRRRVPDLVFEVE